MSTDLISAISSNDIARVKYDIAKGADVNFKPEKDSATPLLIAIASKSEIESKQEIIKVLLTSGASLDQRGYEDNVSPIEFCNIIHNQYLLNLLYANGALKTTDGIMQAAKMGDYALVKRCLSEGVSAKCKDEDGYTPLHIALSKDVAQLLINYGAIIDAKANDGETPLFTTTSPDIVNCCYYMAPIQIFGIIMVKLHFTAKVIK